MLKKVKSILQNVDCNSYYLIANKYVLQQFIFVYRDMSLCLLWLFMSPWINAFIHVEFSLLNTSLKMAKKGQNM